MGTGLVAGLAVGVVLDLAPVLLPERVRAAEPTAVESFSCQFLSKNGYYKFSRFKPAKQRSWPFTLKIDAHNRSVAFSANGSMATEPYFVVGDEIRFNVSLENAHECFRLNSKSRQFETLVDTRHYRVRHAGVCQAQSA